MNGHRTRPNKNLAGSLELFKALEPPFLSGLYLVRAIKTRVDFVFYLHQVALSEEKIFYRAIRGGQTAILREIITAETLLDGFVQVFK